MSLQHAWTLQTALHVATAAIELSARAPHTIHVDIAGKTRLQSPNDYLLAKGLSVAGEAIHLAKLLKGMNDGDLNPIRYALAAIEGTFNTDTNRLCIIPPAAKLLRKVAAQAFTPYELQKIRLPHLSCKGHELIIAPYAMCLGGILLDGSQDVRVVSAQAGPLSFRDKVSFSLLTPKADTQQALVEHWIDTYAIPHVVGCLDIILNIYRDSDDCDDNRNVIAFAERYKNILKKLEQAPEPQLTQRQAWETAPAASVTVDFSQKTPISISPSPDGECISFTFNQHRDPSYEQRTPPIMGMPTGEFQLVQLPSARRFFEHHSGLDPTDLFTCFARSYD